MSAPTDQYIYSPIMEPDIRLLRITHVPEDQNEPLECELKHASSDSNSRYHALSYVWGDTGTRVPIIVNGRRLGITPSLYSALRDVSKVLSEHPGAVTSPSSSALLAEAPSASKNEDDQDPEVSLHLTQWIWADAICIDQSNEEEKSAQVPRMGSLYASAWDVLAWLGTSSAEYRERAASLFKLIASFPCKSVNKKPSESKESQAPLDVDIDTLTEEMTRFWSAVRGWFTRIWTMQEGLLNPRLWLLYGGNRSPWSQLAFAHRLILGQEDSPRRRLYWENSSPIVDFSDLVDSADHGQGHIVSLNEMDTANRLLRLQLLIPFRVCSLPHDAIYGLLGLIDASNMPPHLKPNYENDYKHVFHQYVVWSISQTGSLTVMQSAAQMPGMPTWVPDFMSWIYIVSPWLFAQHPRSSSITFSADQKKMYARGVVLGIMTGSCTPDASGIKEEKKAGLWTSSHLRVEFQKFWDGIVRKAASVQGTEPLEVWSSMVSWLQQRLKTPPYVNLMAFREVGSNDDLLSAFLPEEDSDTKNPGSSPADAIGTWIRSLRWLFAKAWVWVVLENGKWGYVRGSAGLGIDGQSDMVCVLRGATRPFGLRSVRNGEYQYAGICVIPGYDKSGDISEEFFAGHTLEDFTIV